MRAGDRLLRPAFGTYRIEWPTDNSVEFHLSHGDWIRLLRQSGFEIEDLVELRPKPDATTTYQFVTLDWARKWPSKEVWKTRRREALSSSTHSRHRLPSCGRSALLYLYGIDHKATCYEAGPSKEEGMNRQVLICSASGAPSDVLVGRAITMGIDRRHMSGRRHHVNV